MSAPCPVAYQLATREAGLPRAPITLLDLRRRSERIEGVFDGDEVFRRDAAFMQWSYANPLPLKPDPLLLAEGAMMFSGAILAEGDLVHGSAHPNSAASIRGQMALADRYKAKGRAPLLPGTTALIHVPGFRNYFHWTIEALPRLMALEAFRREGGHIDRLLLPMPDPPPFVMQSLAEFFPDFVPLVEFVTKPHWQFERVLFFLDMRVDKSVLTRFKQTTAAFADRVAPPAPSTIGRALLISRRDAGNRRLVNEEVLAKAVAPMPLDVLVGSDLSVAEQRRMAGAARLVIGVHGAGLTNALFCRPGTAMIELTTTQYIRRARSYGDIAAYRGLPYALAVVDQQGDRWVVENNRGNDLHLAPEAIPQLRATARELLDRTGGWTVPAARA